MERDQRIGLSLGSVLPGSAVPVIGLPLAAWITRRSGYAFWQVLPLRSVSVADLKRAGIPVQFVEPAWNPTTFLAHRRHELGAEGMPTKWQDPLFFPDPRTCERLFNQILGKTNAKPIYHHLVMMYEGGLVEVHRGLAGTVEDWVAAAEEAKTKPFVVDLRHLRLFPEALAPEPKLEHFWEHLPPPWWKETLEALLPHTALIHVQAADAHEWREFIKGDAARLDLMLWFIRDQGYTGPFVVEFDPRATGPTGLLPQALAKNLRRVRERIEEQIQ